MENEDDLSKVGEAAVKYGKFMSPEDFLEWEFRQEEKHEYIDGEIRLMAGGSSDHSLISANIVGSLWQSFGKEPCVVLTSDQMVSVKSAKSYFYPDAIIVCGEREFDDSKKYVIRNPTVIFEVLSLSTQDYDQGKKFFFYMQLQSVREIIMIDSTQFFVRVARRQPDNTWKLEEIKSNDEVINIESAGVNLPLSHIYKGINFK